jgi:hypothetical protein
MAVNGIATIEAGTRNVLLSSDDPGTAVIGNQVAG